MMRTMAMKTTTMRGWPQTTVTATPWASAGQAHAHSTRGYIFMCSTCMGIGFWRGEPAPLLPAAH